MAFVRTHYNNIATAAFLSLLLLLSIFGSGCSDEFKNRKALEKMLGQEIRFPDSLKIINRDQVEDSSLLSLDNKIKLVFYISPDECSTCRISSIYTVDTLFKIIPPTMFVPVVIVSPDEETRDETIKKLYDGWFDFPIYDDILSEFTDINKFIPKSSSFHAFLLDRNDRIALVGDPTRNRQILELYIKSLPNLAEAQD